MKKLLLFSLLVLFACSKEDNSELIDSYTSQISSLNSQLSQLNTQLAQSQSQITNLQSQVNSISGLEVTIENLNSQITDYQGQVTTLESQISSLNSQLSTNSDLQSTIDSLNSQLASNNTLISSLQEQILALQSSSNSSTDDWPDYAAQGHSMKAIGIWELYSVNGNPASNSNKFKIKIYPSPNNPVKLNDKSSPQTGLIDFKNNTQIGFNYNYGTCTTIDQFGCGGISISSDDGKNGIFRLSDSDVDGIDTSVFSNATNYFYFLYHFSTDSDPEYLQFNLNINISDDDIYPLTFRNAIFYRTN